MRKLINLLLFVFAVGFLFWQRETLVSRLNYFLKGPCDTPIAYRLGTLDKGYQLSKEAFLAKVGQAEAIWEQPVGKNLFIFDPQAELVINLIYTERQAALDRLERLQSGLSTGKSSLEAMITEYESLTQNFKIRLEAFNREVASWHQRDGAPPRVYERLIEEQEGLQVEAEQLNALAKKLNLSVENYNVQVGKFNQNVQTFNEATQTKPESGLYDGTVPKVDIYLTASDRELVHTLAHELGHALSLEHFDSSQAIMYPLTSEIIEPSGKELAVLRAICEEKNWQIFLDRLPKLFR